MWWVALLVLIFLAYIFLILVYHQGFERTLVIPNETRGHTSVSIVIPVRNESANIAALLEDIKEQNYPRELYEVIVVDDHSTDDTLPILKQFKGSNLDFPLHILELSDATVQQAYKKAAIEMALREAKGTLIVTTDGDCRVPSNWLQSFVSCYEKEHCKLMTGPVRFDYKAGSLVEEFQALDFVCMMGITAGAIQTRLHHMGNGANLCYERAAFDAVGGYRGNTDYASGDDLFLMHKVAAKYPIQIRFVKNIEAQVVTKPQENWSTFLQQRLRWSSKSTAYQEKQMTYILGLVYLVNLLTPFVLLGGLFYAPARVPLLGILFMKWFVDLRFLHTVCGYFNMRRLLRSIIPIGILHILYIVGVGTLGTFVSFDWKGRKIRR
jgi:cellulose synthase/poly-beta-1,6-N-acetylglucosamine synthase-like glycosyltransferase